MFLNSPKIKKIDKIEKIIKKKPTSKKYKPLLGYAWLLVNNLCY